MAPRAFSISWSIFQKVEKCQFRSHEILSLDHSPFKWIVSLFCSINIFMKYINIDLPLFKYTFQFPYLMFATCLNKFLLVLNCYKTCYDFTFYNITIVGSKSLLKSCFVMKLENTKRSYSCKLIIVAHDTRIVIKLWRNCRKSNYNVTMCVFVNLLNNKILFSPIRK
jgi:hypothetical protein